MSKSFYGIFYYSYKNFTFNGLILRNVPHYKHRNWIAGLEYFKDILAGNQIKVSFQLINVTITQNVNVVQQF